MIALVLLAAGCGHGGSQRTDAGIGGTDAPGDTGSDAGDTGSDAGDTGTCGGAICYAGQSCLADHCSFTACNGSHVPGDYATIQQAIDALTHGGGSGTICLAAQTYAESPMLVTGTVTIEGVSPSQSIVTGDLDMPYGDGLGDVGVSLVGLSIHGVTLRTGVEPGNGTASFTACSIGTLDLAAGNASLVVSLDGVDISSGDAAAAITIGQSDGAFSITAENSYIHDSGYGVHFIDNVSPASSSLTFLNNTFETNGTAISTPEGCVDLEVCAQPSVSYFNNVFTKNTLAVDTETNEVIADGNNALFGNTTNYAGIAADGPDYVKSDPQLDASTPPGLQLGSPCRGAGDPSHASPHDFWGRPRGASIDIGAVQSSP